MKTFKELSDDIITNEGTNARQRGEVQSPRSPEEYDALSPADKKIVDKRTANARKQGMSRQPGESPRNKRTKRKPRNRNRNLFKNVKEAWGSTNPKVPFNGEYEVEFAPNSVTGRSAFYVDHDGGFTDKPGLIYVKTDYKGKGDSNTNEKKFIATLKKHLAAARKAGERVNVEVH